MKRHHSMGASVLTAGALALGALALGAQDSRAEVDFSGKRINVIITTTPGGGTDGTTRLLVRYMEKYLPGQPQHIVRNMPGGHGSKALTYFYHEAKPDGLLWTGSSSAQLDATNLQRDVFDYDPRHFEFFGGVNRGGSIVLVRKDKMPNLRDPSQPPVVAGEIDGSRSWGLLITWGADQLKWNLRFVIGYPGTPSLVLAARRGEIDMMATSNIELLRGLFGTGDFVGLSQYGQLTKGKVMPRSSFPDVPVFFDQMQKADISGQAKEAFEYWAQTLQADKWYALPPKAPKDVVDTYRAAWDSTVADPQFIKEGKAQFSADFQPQDGTDVLAIVKATAYPKKEVLDFIAEMKERHGLPAQGLSDEEKKRLAKKFAVPAENVSTTLTDVKREGRELYFAVKGDTHKAKVSGSRTKVTIAGKEAKRAALQAGMTCEIEYLGDGQEARKVDCK